MDMVFVGFSLVSRSFHDETHSSRSGSPGMRRATKRNAGWEKPPASNRADGSGADAKKKNRQAPVQEEEGGGPIRVAPRFSLVSGPASFGNAIFRLLSTNGARNNLYI